MRTVSEASTGPSSRPSVMRMTCTPVTAVAGHDRPLDRRGAAPARQQRGVQVEAAQARRVQHLRGQDLAEGDHHGGVQFEGAEGGDLLRIAHGGGVRTSRPWLSAKAWTGEGLQRLAAPARRRRLGIDRRDLVPGRDQFGQGGNGEFGSAEEGDAHGGV
jgi:hypothetical protein